MSYVLLQWSNQPILPNVIVLEEHVLRALKYMTLNFATNLVLNLWQENLGSIYRHTWQLTFWENDCYLQYKMNLCTESQKFVKFLCKLSNYKKIITFYDQNIKMIIFFNRYIAFILDIVILIYYSFSNLCIMQSFALILVFPYPFN